jgi:predicted O-linked N-acetylglucosamine transferase (SPINDLY family)
MCVHILEHIPCQHPSMTILRTELCRRKPTLWANLPAQLDATLGRAVNANPLVMAVAAFRQGQLNDARARCEQLLRQNNSDAGAWQLLGLIALQARDLESAVQALERALRLQPDQPAILVNLGVSLRSLGRFQEALSCYDRALRLQPDIPEALNNRGSVLLNLRRYVEALESCERALLARPNYAEAQNNKGSALQGLGRLEDALSCCDTALRLMPGLASAHNNRAAVLLALKRPEEALTACDCALQIDPSSADAHNNRGIALKDLGRVAEALQSCERALRLQPGLADAHANRGGLLTLLGHTDDALESIDRAVKLKGQDATLLCNRGAILRQMGRRLDALSSFEAALRIDQHSTLALRAKAEVLAELGRYEEAAACLTALLERAPDSELGAGQLMHCRLNLCDWTDYDSRVSSLLASVARGEPAVAPFWCLALSASGSVQLQCARIFATYHRVDTIRQAPRHGHRHDRIRIGYLSADFREHAVSRLLIGVWEQHDRSRFETYAISLHGKDDSELGRRAQSAFDHFEDASKLSDQAAAGLIGEREVDILIDLTGLTAGMRPGILARRGAPLQVNYLGYPGSVGRPDTDYIIGDRFTVPATATHYYSERVVRLPVCFQANDHQRPLAQRLPARSDLGLPPEAMVFCSFNNSNKLTPAMFGVWMRLLKTAENSVLWIVADPAVTRTNLRREAVARKIDPNRLIFAPRRPYAEHLARLPLADLFLDTYPFNGGSTASDALSMGVPLLTCCGEAFASRMAGSLLNTLGLPELITHSLQEYEEIALALLHQPFKLAELRARLARNLRESALFDSRSACRDLESAFLLMWHRHQRGEPPADLDVQPTSP